VRIGPRTGNSANFKNFNDLWIAYEKQSRFLTGITLLTANIAGVVQKLLGHCPFQSCLLDDCIKRRRDMVEGGVKYSLSGTAVIGSTNVCDGLMALKKLVFEERRYSIAEVRDALASDFEGNEEMRQVLMNQKYRFGNDIEEVDEMANRVNAVHAEFCVSHPDMRGGHYTCGIWPVNDHVAAGQFTAALPDGRHKGAPLADGVGACHGADINGPTALLKSVARLNNVDHWQGGNTCNIKFSRGSIKSRNGLKCMEDLVETFMTLGGQELQINVVDAATLRAAQKSPDEYADLVVRVAGYSAYFVTLSREIQNEVISRTEQVV
jgi:formate C-acetyltransferase